MVMHKSTLILGLFTLLLYANENQAYEEQQNKNEVVSECKGVCNIDDVKDEVEEAFRTIEEKYQVITQMLALVDRINAYQEFLNDILIRIGEVDSQEMIEDVQESIKRVQLLIYDLEQEIKKLSGEVAE